MPSAILLTAALGAADGKNLKDLRLAPYEKLDVPGKGEPEYTDEEAAAFAKRLERLNPDPDRKGPTTLKGLLAELEIDPRKMRGGGIHVGNATDWVEYRLSPGYTLSAAYTQQAPKETAFRSARIIKREPVKPE